MTEADQILDDLLSRWHHYCKTFSAVPVVGATPAFRQARSSRSWDTTDDILESEHWAAKMEAIDFQITGDEEGRGGLPEPYRAAICILARNCYTGASVWLSPRLPRDPIERGKIVKDARTMLTRRLVAAGVM